MAIQLPGRILSRVLISNSKDHRRLPRATHRDLGVRVPLLERLELLQPEEDPELIHRAHAPLARLRDAEALDEAQHARRAAPAVRAPRLLRRVVQDLRDVVVRERPVRLARQPAERALARVRLDAPDRLEDRGHEVLEGELVDGLPGVLERAREEVLGPGDVLLRGDGVPLEATMSGETVLEGTNQLTR